MLHPLPEVSCRRPARISAARLIAAAFVWALGLIAPQHAFAFPPSPHYTIFGMVRDQVGQTLQSDSAVIILLLDGVEIARAPISNALRTDWNYELSISIDQNRAATRRYSPSAVPALGLYSLAVELQGQRYYPIEASGTLRAGQGGERIQLDLNLGADSDGDGLPDAWEEWQLYQSGAYPGSAGWNLARINREGDFDGDGVSNFIEYVAGTFAGDATERFELKLVSLEGAEAAFEFFAITGKVYKIESSTDLLTWTPLPFRMTRDGTPGLSHRAADVAVLPAYATVPAGQRRFFRLTVR